MVVTTALTALSQAGCSALHRFPGLETLPALLLPQHLGWASLLVVFAFHLHLFLVVGDDGGPEVCAARPDAWHCPWRAFSDR